MRTTVAVALGVAILSMLSALVLPPDPIAPISSFLAMVILALTPFLVAAAATRLGVVQASSPTVQEGSMSDTVLMTLHRRRIPIGFAAGLIPLIAVQGARTSIDTAISINSLCLDGCFWPLFMPQPDFDRARPYLMAVFAAWGVGQLGLSLTAATLGTSVARWVRRKIQAVVLSLALTGLLSIAEAYWLPTAVFEVQGASTEVARMGSVTLLFGTAFAIAPFVPGLAILRFARSPSSKQPLQAG